MRNNPWLWCVLLVAAAVGSTAAEYAEPAGRIVQRGSDAAPKAESPVGTWSGTWEGAGSGGGFELTFEQAKDGPVTGKLSVTGEPTYKATLRSLAFDGKKMTAKYDFPADDSAEVTLAGSFDGTKATGTWSLAAKGTDTVVISGTWSVARK
jgi:hypothetical protein